MGSTVKLSARTQPPLQYCTERRRRGGGHHVPLKREAGAREYRPAGCACVGLGGVGENSDATARGHGSDGRGSNKNDARSPSSGGSGEYDDVRATFCFVTVYKLLTVKILKKTRRYSAA